MRALLALLPALVLVGCDTGPKPPKQGPVSGKLTLDGKPVATANIRFIALDPAGVNALARVADGAYSVPAEKGPAKGKYRIEFSVPSGKTKKMQNPDNPLEWLEEPIETLPAKFHRDSEYTIEYDPDGKTTFDWELKTK